MSCRRYLNGRQVDEQGFCLLAGRPAMELPHGCSWSSLETFLRSRKTYLRKHHLGTLQTPPTNAMKFGQVTHICVLEPERFAREVVVPPQFSAGSRVGRAVRHDGPLAVCDAKKDSKAWRDFREENPTAYVVTPEEHKEASDIRAELGAIEGKIHASQAEYDKARTIRDAVWAHPIARAILEKKGALKEAEASWLDQSGLRMFAHPDVIWPGGGADLKTSKDVRGAEFASSAERYGYHRQAGIYLVDAHQEFFGGPGERFFHIVTGSAEPYDVEVYEMDPEWIEDGVREVRDILDRLAACVRNNDWRSPGEKAGGAVELMRPPWAAGKRLAYELPG